MTLLRRNLILHLNTAISIYVLFALLDVYFTLRGVNGNITLEGNPVMRYMMVSFGLMGGLIVEKSLVLLVSLLVAIVAVIGIEKEADCFHEKTRSYHALEPHIKNLGTSLTRLNNSSIMCQEKSGTFVQKLLNLP
ncbi:MAG: hypothetical protein JSW12_00875 [Deltaproteobacteria bacterium]|nr:MAG: hypothetical protein JSW12_00875 [Deltaproteobacteria bacterium]